MKRPEPENVRTQVAYQRDAAVAAHTSRAAISRLPAAPTSLLSYWALLLTLALWVELRRTNWILVGN